MVDYSPEKLIECIRDGLVEQEHSGFILKLSSDGIIFKIGDDKNYPFFLRSCAKPLQACLVVDFGVDEYFNMTSKEIAICCASHAGETCHVDVVKGFLKKIGLDETFLKCGYHKPISKEEQRKLIISGEKESILQNNCSGKHVMMLAICKKMGWDLKTYDETGHPLQKAIKEKIYELCELKEEFPITSDGCGVPIHSMPLENMLKGYLNLFLNSKYEKIRRAFQQNHYIVGGFERLDTEIMNIDDNLIAKVGAGGLCIVVNINKKEAFIVKILDCDMKARAIAVFEFIYRINWLSENKKMEIIPKIHDLTGIKTLHGQKVGVCAFLPQSP